MHSMSLWHLELLSCLSSMIYDGTSTSDDIAEVLAKKYESLYQSMPTNCDELHDLHCKKIDSLNVHECKIAQTGLGSAIVKFSKGKSGGNHSFYSAHIN